MNNSDQRKTDFVLACLLGIAPGSAVVIAGGTLLAGRTGRVVRVCSRRLLIKVRVKSMGGRWLPPNRLIPAGGGAAC